MEDRIPTAGQEGRVLITPENGSAPFYATVTMADNPTNPGTPLNKETLLQDSTEIEIFGNASNRTVDEAFSGIMDRIDLIMQNVASMALTVTDVSGNPIENVSVNGVFNENGNPVITNSNGQATGYVSEGTTEISVSGYADIENYSEQFTAVKGENYEKTIQVTTRDFIKISSSHNVKFSGNVSAIDFSIVGGGGGGGLGKYQPYGESSGHSVPGGGGGGGYCQNFENISVSANTNYPVSIGAGGRGGTETSSTGGTGGSTSFMNHSVNGGNGGTAGEGEQTTPINNWTPGQGGTGNGKGGKGGLSMEKPGTNGGDGTVLGFSSFTDTVKYGGGGAGAGSGSDGHSLKGGADFGADYEKAGANGTGGGGSGADGEGRGFNGNAVPGFRGGSGCVAIRMHLKSAE